MDTIVSAHHSTQDHIVELTSALIVTRRQNVYMDVVDVEKDTLELDTFARKIRKKNVASVLFIIIVPRESVFVFQGSFAKIAGVRDAS